MNLLLYGKAGTGKTSAASVLANGCSVYDASTALKEADSVVQQRLESFATSASIECVPKVLLINEIDRMSRKVQLSMLDLIEKCQGTTRFVFTTNSVNKVIGGIRSRCQCVSFDVVANEKDELIRRAILRYEDRLPSLGFQYDSKRLSQIVSIYYPDYRAIANQIQFEFKKKAVEPPIPFHQRFSPWVFLCSKLN